MIDRRPQHELSLSEKVDLAFEQVAKKVIRRAERTDTQVLIWRNNQIVRLTPEQANQELLSQKKPEST